MEAAKIQPSHSFLPDRRNETNSKDRLYNSLLEYLDKHNLKWSASEVSSYGKKFLKALTDLLWYIDGQHDRFNCQSCIIPEVFQIFQGYNRPGHRKRAARNFSHTDLESYCHTVYMCLLSDHWGRKDWKSFKADISHLLYTDELEQHNKRTKHNHQSPSSVREVSSSISCCSIYINPLPAIDN